MVEREDILLWLSGQFDDDCPTFTVSLLGTDYFFGNWEVFCIDYSQRVFLLFFKRFLLPSFVPCDWPFMIDYISGNPILSKGLLSIYTDGLILVSNEWEMVVRRQFKLDQQADLQDFDTMLIGNEVLPEFSPNIKEQINYQKRQAFGVLNTILHHRCVVHFRDVYYPYPTFDLFPETSLILDLREEEREISTGSEVDIPVYFSSWFTEDRAEALGYSDSFVRSHGTMMTDITTAISSHESQGAIVASPYYMDPQGAIIDYPGPPSV